MNTQPFKDFVKNKPMRLIVGGGAIAVAFGAYLILPTENMKDTPIIEPKNEIRKEIGVAVGDVDKDAHIKSLDNKYYDFEDRMKFMEEQLKKFQSLSERIESTKVETDQKISNIDQTFDIKIQNKIDQLKDERSNNSEGAQDVITEKKIELLVADINPKDEEDWVYLPIGSFCKGTLLTGVYAAADANNPLPVLISLDEAFYGPNKSRIPLKGAFVLGKAFGDLVSERALIQIVAISSVLPNSHAFENERDLGYVTDEEGELGIKGQVVYNTGRQLALSFMGGFVSGGSQAMADSQVTTHRTYQGDTSKEVTGDPTKNMLFSGLAQSAGKLAEYYEKQAQEMVPAVHIKNGVPIVFIVQKGITITGLAKSNFENKRFMD